jgi:hypothetical protein
MDNTYKVQFRVVLSSSVVLLVKCTVEATGYQKAVSMGRYQLAQTLSNLGYDNYGKRITRVTAQGDEEW